MCNVIHCTMNNTCEIYSNVSQDLYRLSDPDGEFDPGGSHPHPPWRRSAPPAYGGVSPGGAEPGDHSSFRRCATSNVSQPYKA